jgi:MarR family transcriptional regulator for hemolysin
VSPPATLPIGLHLARSAKTVSRAFDDALSAAGGSLPSWLVLLSLKTRELGTQRELASAVGIRGATLTRHLDGMEAAGLVARRRDPDNRRIQHVEITAVGDAAFIRMRDAAVTFDRRIRRGLSTDDTEALTDLLNQLQHNATEL